MLVDIVLIIGPVLLGLYLYLVNKKTPKTTLVAGLICLILFFCGLSKIATERERARREQEMERWEINNKIRDSLNKILGKDYEDYIYNIDEVSWLEELFSVGQFSKKNYKIIQIINLFEDYRSCPNAYVEIKVAANILLGNCHYYLFQLIDAKECYEEALKLISNIKDDKVKLRGKVIACSNIGLIDVDLGKADKALRNFKKALVVYQKLRNEQGKAIAFANIGRAYMRQGKPDSALKYFERALEINKKNEDTQKMATNLSYIGLTHSYLGKFDKALQLLNDALEINKKNGFHQATIATLNYIGLILLDLKEFDEALQYFKEVQEMFYEKGEELGRENPFFYTRGDFGSPDISLQYLNEALSINLHIENEISLANQFSHIGSILDAWNKQSEALLYYKKSLEIYKNFGYEPYLAYTLCNIGFTCKDLNKLDDALQNFKDALEICQRIESEPNEAAIHWQIGLIYKSLNKPNKASQHLEIASEIYQRIESEPSIPTAHVLAHLGLIHMNLGKPDAVLQRFRGALENGSWIVLRPDMASALDSIYLMYTTNKKVLQFLDEILVISRKDGYEHRAASALNSMGFIYKNLGKPDTALQCFREALEIGRESIREPDIANSLSNIGLIYWESGKSEEALQYLKEALEINRKIGREKEIANQLYSIGLIYGELDKSNEALHCLNEAWEISKSIGDQSLIEKVDKNINDIEKEKREGTHQN